MPVKGNQIPNYEKLNNSSLYVIGYDEKDQFFQCTLFQFKWFCRNGFAENQFSWILLKLVSLYFSLSSGFFFSQKVLNNHKQFCLHHQPVSTIFPVEGVNGAFKVKENKFQFALILISKLFKKM